MLHFSFFYRILYIFLICANILTCLSTVAYSQITQQSIVYTPQPFTALVKKARMKVIQTIWEGTLSSAATKIISIHQKELMFQWAQEKTQWPQLISSLEFNKKSRGFKHMLTQMALLAEEIERFGEDYVGKSRIHNFSINEKIANQILAELETALSMVLINKKHFQEVEKCPQSVPQISEYLWNALHKNPELQASLRAYKEQILNLEKSNITEREKVDILLIWLSGNKGGKIPAHYIEAISNDMPIDSALRVRLHLLTDNKVIKRYNQAEVLNRIFGDKIYLLDNIRTLLRNNIKSQEIQALEYYAYLHAVVGNPAVASDIYRILFLYYQNTLLKQKAPGLIYIDFDRLADSIIAAQPIFKMRDELNLLKKTNFLYPDMYSSICGGGNDVIGSLNHSEAIANIINVLAQNILMSEPNSPIKELKFNKDAKMILLTYSTRNVISSALAPEQEHYYMQKAFTPDDAVIRLTGPTMLLNTTKPYASKNIVYSHVLRILNQGSDMHWATDLKAILPLHNAKITSTHLKNKELLRKLRIYISEMQFLIDPQYLTLLDNKTLQPRPAINLDDAINFSIGNNKVLSNENSGASLSLNLDSEVLLNQDDAKQVQKSLLNAMQIYKEYLLPKLVFFLRAKCKCKYVEAKISEKDRTALITQLEELDKEVRIVDVKNLSFSKASSYFHKFLALSADIMETLKKHTKSVCSSHSLK